MNNTFHTLEFDRIVRQLEELACTKSAKEKIRDLEPYLYEGDVRKSQKDTSEARRIIESAGLPPIASMGDVDDILIVIGQDSRAAGIGRYDADGGKTFEGLFEPVQILEYRSGLL